MSFLFCMHVADNIFRVLTLGTLARKSERNIVSVHCVVSNFVSMWIIIQRLNKWHFSLCCANMTEEVKPRVAFGFSSSMVILAMHPLIKLIDSWQRMDCNRYAMMRWRATHYPTWQENWQFYFNWVSCRSSFNSGWHLFYKHSLVNGNCFKSDAPE